MRESEKDFDPSGKVASQLVAQAGYLSPYLFLEKLDLTNGYTKNEDCFHRESTLLKRICLVIFVIFHAHSLYSLFFTSFIFHAIGEAVVGWMCGMAITGFMYETTCVSNVVDEAVE